MKPDLTADITRVVEGVGQEFDLNIDQLGGLDAEIFDVINGIKKPSDFVHNIQDRLEIGHDPAVSITNLVNEKIFSLLEEATEHENQQQHREISLQAIEQAGNFEIERPMAPIPVRKSLNILEEDAAALPADLETVPVTEEKRDIMAGIENPTPSDMKPATTPLTVPVSAPMAVPTQTYPKKEPLVEQLLRGTTAIPEQKIVRQAPPEQTKRPAITVPPRSGAGDPYRESIE